MGKTYQLLKKEDCSKILKNIEKYTYVSFDMFDTLIKRDCFRPSEIFSFVEKRIDQTYHRHSSFSKLRIEAEKKARKNIQNEEVTIEQIYDLFPNKFPRDILNHAKTWEMDYELALCQMNPAIRPVYEYCKSHDKKIIIVTDIYLPEALIEKILDKSGIKYDSLFVSSTYKQMKAKGSLFRTVLTTLSIPPSELIHIGDNEKSDYEIPIKLGIHAIHITKDSRQNLFINKKEYRCNASYANLCEFISNHLSNSSISNSARDYKEYFTQAGYEVEGPVLYGFITWLQKEFKEAHIEKVFFLSRDGQIMQKAYKRLSEQVPNEYMYASRKALIIPTIWMCPELSDLSHMMYWPTKGTISSFLKKIGLVSEDFCTLFANKGFDCQKEYKYSNLWENQDFVSLYDDYIKEAAIKNSKRSYELLVSYLKQLNFTGKVAIIDIGWFGHMQAALQKVINAAGLPVDLNGYYIGLRPNSSLPKSSRAKGFLFDREVNSNDSTRENSFNSIVEALFTANHGTTKGYKVEKGLIVPTLGQWEYCDDKFKNDYLCIKSAQDGALKFVDDMLSVDAEFRLSFDSRIAFINWLQLGCKPSQECAEYFGDLHMLDDDSCFLAKPKEHFNYFLHSRVLLQDLRHSLWLVGFMTRLYGDSISWFDLYQLMHRLHWKLKRNK